MLTATLRMGLAVFTGFLVYGQAVDKSLNFDVASVKPTAPPSMGGGRKGGGGGRGGPGSSDPGRIHYVGITLKSLLMNAYDVKDFQIAGPGLLDTERFDVTATIPPDTTTAQLRVMLQNLLAERFKMALHRETKELPMYSLVVARSGLKMEESAAAPAVKDEGDAPPPPLPMQPKMGPDGFPIIPMGGRVGIFGIMMNGSSRWIAQQTTMQDLTNRLTNQVSRPVIDATGLKAKYDFTLTFAPEGMNGPLGPMGPPPGGGAAAAGPPEAEALPDIFAAVQAQLGLRLEPKKGPVEMIVIDHVERTPTEN